MPHNLTFDERFSALYGSRWEGLRQALLVPERQVLWAWRSEGEPEIPWLPGCVWRTSERQDWPRERGSDQKLRYYALDPASVLAARALKVAGAERVLDLCAAPGGKTLELLRSLGAGGRLISNEPSRPRRERLTQVIRQYAPDEVRERVEVRGKDGARYGMTGAGDFDAVLVDAPCSGERHLLEHPEELKRWSPARSKSLARRQYALLASALLAVKPGGRIVYSTCTLSPDENDAVVQRLLDRKEGEVSLDAVQEPPSPWAERTETGWLHLPDRCGFGPLYFSCLRRAA